MAKIRGIPGERAQWGFTLEIPSEPCSSTSRPRGLGLLNEPVPPAPCSAFE